MGAQTRATILLKNYQKFFALAETVEKRSARGMVQGMSAEPQEMAGDSLEFRQDCSNHARARWSFRHEQFFHRFAISQAAADGSDVVHTVDIGSELLVGAVFRDFLDTAVEIADDALRADNALAVELQLDAQNAVGRRMLRSHVDDEFIRAQQRLVIACGLDTQSRRPFNAKIALAIAPNPQIFTERDGV